ncbi:uncharacterized protein LOC126410201 [Nymphaea colorata]|uniref:uncharacterized protein LOC126410201 n=1 Tax=Nymphaea colorata TaxID=210225 RepID=UPI00214F192E|nr:uncharacterized protein LOC126410201 [Nymphaea colorata]
MRHVRYEQIQPTKRSPQPPFVSVPIVSATPDVSCLTLPGVWTAAGALSAAAALDTVGPSPPLHRLASVFAVYRLASVFTVYRLRSKRNRLKSSAISGDDLTPLEAMQSVDSMVE